VKPEWQKTSTAFKTPITDTKLRDRSTKVSIINKIENNLKIKMLFKN
jgi:hypothetical protein